MDEWRLNKETVRMELNVERDGGTVVVGAGERIDGTNAREFQSALEDAIEETDRAVILDLADLTYISSAGLRAILMTARSLRRQDAALAVCSLTDSVREVFEISGFNQIIPVHSSRDDAVNALNG
ncbi:MAG: STAS domain-containing protein [Dehalococcoidia bacterium]|nr:STAS domain-containing protein [Dehalococcoidia bacterium]